MFQFYDMSLDIYLLVFTWKSVAIHFSVLIDRNYLYSLNIDLCKS